MRGTTLSFSAALVAAMSLPAFAVAVPHPPVAARMSHLTRQIRSRANAWKISDAYEGSNFYDQFDFFTASDPTEGLVNYVSLKEARAKNLTHADDGSFVIRGDNTNKLDRGQKRDSVRISSKKQYKQHIQIANIEHMPQGLGTWPAYWTTGDNWPYEGEIDIVEGANDNGPNLQSLHTGPGCVMRDSSRKMKGDSGHTDCNSFASGNAGCGVKGDSKRDFGPAFNHAGGGYFATVRTQTEIKMYFWSRQDDSVPDEVRSNSVPDSVDPSTWGRPTSTFNSDACDLDEKFGPNMIVINLTFCGGFGGATFPGGRDACEAFVRDHPGEYDEAFWSFLWLRVYERA